MVVNVDDAVASAPPDERVRADTVYDVPVESRPVLCHEEPSDASSPSTVAPFADRTSTDVRAPPCAAMTTCWPGRTSVAPEAGVNDTAVAGSDDDEDPAAWLAPGDDAADPPPLPPRSHPVTSRTAAIPIAARLHALRTTRLPSLPTGRRAGPAIRLPLYP